MSVVVLSDCLCSSSHSSFRQTYLVNLHLLIFVLHGSLTRFRILLCKHNRILRIIKFLCSIVTSQVPEWKLAYCINAIVLHSGCDAQWRSSYVNSPALTGRSYPEFHHRVSRAGVGTFLVVFQVSGFIIALRGCSNGELDLNRYGEPFEIQYHDVYIEVDNVQRKPPLLL